MRRLETIAIDGDKLRRFIISKGDTLAKAAAELGVSGSCLGRYITQDAMPKTAYLALLGVYEITDKEVFTARQSTAQARALVNTQAIMGALETTNDKLGHINHNVVEILEMLDRRLQDIEAALMLSAEGERNGKDVG